MKYGKGRRIKTIGRYPEKNLKDARILARQLLSRYSSRISTESYEDAVASFLEESKHKNRPNTVRNYRMYLEAFESGKNVSDISRKELRSHLARYKDKPTAYKNCLMAFKVFFNFCIRTELCDRHPLTGERPPPTSSRERVLTPDEIRELWAYDYPQFSTILKLLLCLGQRRTQTAAIVPEWISERDMLLSFPGEYCKSGKRHTIPITEYSLPLLKQAPFGRDGGPYNGWSNGMKRLRKYARIDFTLHDCRRTYATICASLGIDIHLTELLLGHVSGSTSGIVGVYQKYSYIDEMRQAQEKFEHCLQNIIKS